MQLIVMRHCKSSWATAGLADHDRQLNARGRASAAALGDWLRKTTTLPDLALVSTSLRTRQTFEGLKLDCDAQYDKRLYHADAETILACVEEQPESVKTLLVIGHNPGFADFAWRFARIPVDHPRFGDYPTGATTVFDVPGTTWLDMTWSKANARDFVIPRALIEA